MLDVEEVDGSEAHVEVELGILLELHVSQLLHLQQVLRRENSLGPVRRLVGVAPARPVAFSVSVVLALQKLLVRALVNSNF